MSAFKKTFGMTVGALLGATAIIGAANAVTVTFDFTGGNSASDGSNGNVRLFNSSPAGISLKASGYSTQNTGDGGTFIKGWLGHYANGLGVTNADNDGSHTVDNSGYTDFVVFEFTAAIDIATIRLASYGDADISVWLGTLPANNDFTGGETFANNLGGLAFIGNFDCSNGFNSQCDNGESHTYTINSNLTGNYLVIAGQLGDNNDEFKIKRLTADYTPPTTQVPEPASLALLGMGLVGLGAVRRRKIV